MKSYIWYSPELDLIQVWPVPICREFKTCRWDKCSLWALKPGGKMADIKSMSAFYYIGVL